jgi:hypothetical protein
MCLFSKIFKNLLPQIIKPENFKYVYENFMTWCRIKFEKILSVGLTEGYQIHIQLGKFFKYWANMTQVSNVTNGSLVKMMRAQLPVVQCFLGDNCDICYLCTAINLLVDNHLKNVFSHPHSKVCQYIHVHAL